MERNKIFWAIAPLESRIPALTNWIKFGLNSSREKPVSKRVILSYIIYIYFTRIAASNTASDNVTHRGGGTNLEVGAPVGAKVGGTDPAQSAEKNCWSCPSTFWLFW